MSDPASVAEALDLLGSLGAPERLVRHGEVVAEVASEISREMTRIGMRHDEVFVVVGAALHDAGKIVHPEELAGPGNKHEAAGERLLLERGLSSRLAAVCRTHGASTKEHFLIEDRLIALADHLWKGTRSEGHELLAMQVAADRLSIARWEAFVLLEPVFEQIASGAMNRLARAR